MRGWRTWKGLVFCAVLSVAATPVSSQVLVSGPDAPAELVASLKTSLPSAPQANAAAGVITPLPAPGTLTLAVGSTAAQAAAKSGLPMIASGISDLKSLGIGGKGTAIGVTSDLGEALGFLNRAFKKPTFGLLHTSRNGAEFFARIQSAADRTGTRMVPFQADKLALMGSALGFLQESQTSVILVAPDPLFNQRDVQQVLIKFSLEKRVPIVSLDPANRKTGLYCVLLPDPAASAAKVADAAARAAAGANPASFPEIGPGQYRLALNSKLSSLVKADLDKGVEAQVYKD